MQREGKLLKPLVEDGKIKIYLHVSDLFAENSWFVLIDTNLFLIDPGRGSRSYLEELKNKEHIDMVQVLLTHAHVDHIHDLMAINSEKIYLHPAEKRILLDPSLNLFEQLSISTAFSEQINFEEPEKLRSEWKAIHTPGHTPGSTCYLLVDSYLFTGDTVFADSIGRTDLPGGNWEEMESSIKLLTQLLQKKPDLLIFPGHGPVATAKHILKENPFFSQ